VNTPSRAAGLISQTYLIGIGLQKILNYGRPNMTSGPKKKRVFLNFSFIYLSFQILFSIPEIGNYSCKFKDTFYMYIINHNLETARICFHNFDNKFIYFAK
jgi:hypothetical protein